MAIALPPTPFRLTCPPSLPRINTCLNVDQLKGVIMVHMNVSYEGSLRCRLKHGPSGAVVETDAPKDNHGKGEAFSPTDLVSSALGACMLTLMGIFAGRHGVKLEGTEAEVTKEMVQEPARRIGKITVNFKMPAGIPADKRPLIERAALTCPVHKSLHPDIQIPVEFKYPD